MHLVTAIIKAHRVEAVTEGLKDAGVTGVNFHLGYVSNPSPGLLLDFIL